MITVTVYDGQNVSECIVDHLQEKIWIGLVDPRKSIVDPTRIRRRIVAELVTVKDGYGIYKGEDGEEYYVMQEIRK